jgi:HEAT repeat protein
MQLVFWFQIANDNTNNQNYIATEGGIPPLVRLLNDSNWEVRGNAASALVHLAYGNTNYQEAILNIISFDQLSKLYNNETYILAKNELKILIDICQSFNKTANVLLKSTAAAGNIFEL